MVAKSLGRKLTLKVTGKKNNDPNQFSSSTKSKNETAMSTRTFGKFKQTAAGEGHSSNSTSIVNSASPSDMKGLQLFIADLRSLQNSKQEESTKINNEIMTIKKQFESSKNIHGYKKKKNVCKLLYVYLTSNCSRLKDIEFAYLQMIELMSSTIYSEKFIGYFSSQLLLPYFSTNNKLTALLFENCLKDLDSDNQESVILSLNFIANSCFNFKNENDENDLMEKVFQHLRSPTASPLVKQKSNLAFYALLRSNPKYLSSMDLKKLSIWTQRIVSLVENKDIILSTLPLIQQIISIIGTGYFKNIVPQLTEYLYEFYSVKDKNESLDMNNNWVVIKILDILDAILDENDVTVIDMQTLSRLRMTVSNAIHICTEPTTTSIQKISQSAVLFALINFTRKLDPSHESLVNSVKTLTHLFQSTRDINLKYMTLETLYILSRSVVKDDFGSNLIIDALDSEQCIWDTGFSSKNSSAASSSTSRSSSILAMDASLLGKWIDLVFEITNSKNIKKSIHWLISMMDHPEILASSTTNGLASTSRLDLKQDISFKISILIEKYATDVDWFIDTSLRLLSKVRVADSTICGTSDSTDLIWERLVQIVVNNESLHLKVCDILLKKITSHNTNEHITKAGCYLLGEFSGLVVPTLIGGQNLLELFIEKYFQSQQVSTRALIITAMMKLYRNDLSLGSPLIKFFQLELNSLDLELQTRCVLYLSIIQQTMNGNANLIDFLFQPTPVFKAIDNPLLERLTTIKPTHPVSAHARTSRMNSLLSVDVTGNSSVAGIGSVESVTSAPLLPAPRKQKPTQSTLSNNSSHLQIGETADVGSEKYNSLVVVADSKILMKRMVEHKQGVLFQNTHSKPIKVLFSSRQDDSITNSSTGSLPRLNSYTIKYSLTFVNCDVDYDISSFYCNVVPSQTSENPPYIIKILYLPDSTNIKVGKRLNLQFEIQIRKPFELWNSPILNIQYKVGGFGFNEVNIKMGVSLLSTIVKTGTDFSMSIPQYIQRWKQIGDQLGHTGEYSTRIAHDINNSKLNIDQMRLLVGTKLNIDLIESSSEHAIKNLIFGSSIINTKSDGKFGILIKISFDVKNQEWTITCRSTSIGVIAKCVVESIKLCLE